MSNPFFRIHYYGRLAIGWLFLLGLVFGSAYGFDPTAGGEGRAVRTQAVFGLAVVVFLMWASSRDHKRINWQAVIVGLSLQQFLGMFVLKTLAGFDLFRWIAFAVRFNRLHSLLTSRCVDRRDHLCRPRIFLTRVHAV